jgi:general secretion pathway protein H
MPTSAAGNKAALTTKHSSLGFTLIELLVVIALIAIGTAAVSFSLRDTSETALERDAERLAALLESARARSRSSGVPVRWHPVSESTSTSRASDATAAFVFEGLPPQALPTQWLSPQTQVAANSLLVLGPDPLIGPQSVRLQSQNFQLWVSTDGIQAFHVKRAAP